MRTFFKTALQAILPEQSALYFRLWFRFYWKPKRNSIEWKIYELAQRQAEVFFIQIGSNDGFLGDPLYKFIRHYKWGGILVEPVSYLFKKLKKNYSAIDKAGKLHFEQVAISASVGRKNFYYVKEFTPSKALPVYLNQQGSFNRAHLEKVKKEFPAVEIGTLTLASATVTSLVEKYQPQQVDLIHIDTEGHDYTIIQSIDFERIRPRLILFENRHMSATQHAELQSLLRQRGYSILAEEHDTLAYLGVAEPIWVKYETEEKEVKIGWGRMISLSL